MARFPQGGGGFEAIAHAAIMRGIKFGFYGLKLAGYVGVAVLKTLLSRR